MDMKRADPNSTQLRQEAEAQLIYAPDTKLMPRPTEKILHELQIHQIELEMQNEELRQAQIALEESRDQFVNLYEFSPVGYLTLNHEAMIDEINLTATALLGAERNKLLHHRFAPCVANEDRDRWHRHFLNVLQHDGQQRCELALRCSDGSVLHAQLDCLHMKVDGASSVRIVLTDITQRKQAEESLKNMAAKYHTMFELSSDAIMLLDEKGFFDCNPATLRMFSCPTHGDFIGKHPAEFSPPTQPGGENSMSLANQRIATAFKNGNNLFEWMHRRLDGTDFPAEVLLTVLKLDGKPVFQATVRDITERKHQEEQTAALLELYTSAETLDEKTLLQRGLDTVQHLTGSRIGFLHFVSENQNEIELVTWSSDTLASYCHAASDRAPSHYPVCAAGIWADCIRLKQPVIINDYATAPGKKGLPEGHAHLQRFISMPVFDGAQVRMIIGVGNAAKDYGDHDVEMVKLFGYGLYRIVQRKRAEAAIQHANRTLAALSEVNRNLVYVTDENDLLPAICRAIVEQRGYWLAWVGYKQHDENKSIKVLASAGHDEGYLDAMQLTWAETERGMGPGGRAVRSGVTQLCQDMANDPLCLPWRDAALQHGYASCIVLPLLDGDNAVFGILTVYAAEANAFIPTEVALLEEMAGDLAFGVRTLHTRLERDLALEQNRRQLGQLQDSLEDTVRAIATIVEMRDPYTSGHQVRVADLATAIAKQMGLPEEQIHAIHLAGIVHDLGKIRIPAEILSKPGKITDLEFGLIKVHPQAGYDILKGIQFPWPIAQMVLQHHERLDGTGYPQGLKGEAILLEARILGVADIVEAMSSHRPYRPGLGIEVALAEISQQRGTHYDPQAVDACVAVFREQGYSFKG